MPIDIRKSLKENRFNPYSTQLLLSKTRMSTHKILASGVIAGALFISPELFAANLSFVSSSISVEEPNSGSRTISVQPIVTFNDGDSSWDNTDICTITGEIEVYSGSATQGLDFNILGSASFSLTTQPVVDINSNISRAPVSQEVLFEILDDGDETEGAESISFRIGSYGVTCANGTNTVSRSISGGQSYGSIIINDPFDEKVVEEPEVPQITYEIPLRQKSLSTQLNGIRNLTLHTADTRNRSIAKEIHRARQSGGFNSDNLQVKINGDVLPNGVLGTSAGDVFDDFGRLGFFISGSIDIGDQGANSITAVDFDSSLLIAGIDYRVSNNIVLGSAVSYTMVDSDNLAAADTDFSRSSLALFASYYLDDTFYVDTIVTLGSTGYDLKRAITTDTTPDSASAKTDGDESSAAIGVGYNFHNQNKNLRVFSLVNYIDANIDGYHETVVGSSSAAFVNDIDLQSLTMDIGFELSWNINTHSGVYTPMLSTAWVRQFADDAVDINGNFVDSLSESAFSYRAPDQDDSYWNTQIGINGVFKNGFTAYLTYDTFMGRDDFTSNHYSLGARWQF